MFDLNRQLGYITTYFPGTQISPYENLVLPRNSAVLSACLTACFQGPLRPCKQPRPRLHPALHPIIFLIWCSRTLQWRGFRAVSPVCGGTAHAGCMASDPVQHGQSFDDQPLGFGTLAIHLGNGVDAETGAIRRPITLANTYALCPTTPRPWRLTSISNRWMWCVSWSTPVWNRTRTTRWRSASWPARTPGSAARCRSASTPIMTGTTGSSPSSM